MDHPTHHLDQADEPPEQPTRRLTEPVPAAQAPARYICPECGGPMTTMRVRMGTTAIVVERLDASARELLIHQSSKAKGRSPIEARVCTECGFTKLYAGNLAQLME